VTLPASLVFRKILDHVDRPVDLGESRVGFYPEHIVPGEARVDGDDVEPALKEILEYDVARPRGVVARPDERDRADRLQDSANSPVEIAVVP
jgi:hypothetical protein